MGHRFKHWKARSDLIPQNFSDIASIVHRNRNFQSVAKLDYGNHGLEAALKTILSALKQKKMIALYADYDVDGTMSCVSWIWFLKSIGYTHYVHYIPDRFKEGYGVNLQAIQYLVEEKKADLVITMDTGITANAEAAWCRSRGVDFVCTDHHKVQLEKMPDCTILNPKLHPDPMYQELCGCGITFVLLRQLGQYFDAPAEVWTDILALTGMATICDVVPLNGVNHKLAKQGVAALLRSQRPIFRRLLKAAQLGKEELDEKDVGFRLGPRINAVGRLEHANQVIRAFLEEEADHLVSYMSSCNDKRKVIQSQIVEKARQMAQQEEAHPVLFLGHEDWHQGVVGIAASKIAEEFWRPVWLFQKKLEEGIGKGSARSIPGFDVTDAMNEARHLFHKFGGHRAAGGFSFPLENELAIKQALIDGAAKIRRNQPQLWESTIFYDCALPGSLAHLRLASCLDEMKPFGHCFEEPLFRIAAAIKKVDFLKDKQTLLPKHTAVTIASPLGGTERIMFFNEVFEELADRKEAEFLVTANKNKWQDRLSLSLHGKDFL